MFFSECEDGRTVVAKGNRRNVYAPLSAAGENGRENAKPNPMVGAVIVSGDGRIIGEGYHVRCGEGHAEVNAFASIKPEDEHLLSQATIYVSLEPCSHYGKTPPCADLIVRKE